MLARSEAARQRFLGEARAAAAVHHDHVLTIHAIGQFSTPGGIFPYLVMPYVAGPSLQEVLDRQGPLLWHVAARHGLQIARGLAAAHAQGLVHRDVKPANILLEPIGREAESGPPGKPDREVCQRAKITDFGLALAVDALADAGPGVVAGTPEYMAPEQARGLPVDQRADLFSLGSVLYALCTGQPPFRGDSPLAVLHSVAQEAPRPVRDVHPHIPAWFDTLVMRLLAKDAADRYASAAEVASRLEAGLGIADREGLLKKQSQIRKPKFAMWWAAAAMLVVACLGVTETTGLTRLVDTAAIWLRLRSPHRHSPEGALAVDIKVHENAARDNPPKLKLGPPKLGPRPAEGKVIDQPLLSLAVPEANPACGVFTPDGKTLAVGFWNGDLALWDVASGRKRAARHAPSFDMRCVAVSPDGQTLATGTGDGIVRLWAVDSGELQKELSDHQGRIMGVAFSPDGATLASVGGEENQPGQLRLWNVKTGKPTLAPSDFDMELWSVAYAPDGQSVAVAMGRAAQGKIALVSICDGSILKSFPVAASVRHVAFAPDGKRLAFSHRLGGTASMVDLGKDREHTTFTAGGRSLFTLAFVHQGRRLLTANADETAILWQVESGKRCATFMGHQGEVHFAAMSQDGSLLATGGLDRTIRLWHLADIAAEP